MANKLINLSGLQEFKSNSDIKYQDKLTAGSNISIINDVISSTAVTPTFGSTLSGQVTLSNNTITKMGEITLQQGKYILVYTCTFPTNTSGYRQCGFSTNTTDITGFGRAWGDNQAAVSGGLTQTCVSGTFEVTSSNGQTFYFLAKQTSGGNLVGYPRCNYIKFG